MVIKGRYFGIAVGGGWEVSSRCCGGDIRGKGLERWGLQREQDGGCFSLGRPKSGLNSHAAANTCERGSFKPTISMESGFLFGGVSAAPQVGGLTLAVGGGWGTRNG